MLVSSVSGRMMTCDARFFKDTSLLSAYHVLYLSSNGEGVAWDAFL